MVRETKNAIAIVGLGCVFPGAATPEDFWQNLIAERDLRTPLSYRETYPVDPSDSYDAQPGKPDKYYNAYGGFIRDFTFDPTGYQLPAEYLASLDVTSQWSLHAARAALADANLTSPLARTGVILGNLSFPTRKSRQIVNPLYYDLIERTLRDVFADPGFQLVRPDLEDATYDELRTGSNPADVLGQALGLTGVRLALDAACASSLYAVKLAGDYLLSHRADVMLAGAVSGADPILINGGFSLFRAHPQSGEASHPLNHGSSGLIASEGAGFVALKRYDDAVSAGDHIYGIIRAVGLSNDGNGKHPLSPLRDRQVVAIQRAHTQMTGQHSPVPLQYVECHATGTPLGDQTEIETLTAVFGDEMPLLGSLKSNLGHCLTAAGIGALMKVLLSMQNEVIPPTINVTDPLHPAVVRSPASWDAPHRQAGVNAFGFGGANAHLIVESELTEPVLPVTWTATRMAITGMGVVWGGCEDLATFEQMIFEGQSSVAGLPSNRWRGAEDAPMGQYTAPDGAYLDQFEIDALRYKVQLTENDSPHAQQLCILKAADEAIHDAQLPRGSNVAVIIAMETEAEFHRFRARIDMGWQIEQSLEHAGITLSDDERKELIRTCRDAIAPWPGVNRFTSYIGNIMAGRIAALGDFSGPALTISSGDTSVMRALELARMLL
ncbi:MAG: beta-ketoacyl synthase N-terminal-like domain-containing protein, partial [Chloroflexota bacterium]